MIRIELKEVGSNISLAIVDNGVGIPREFHEKIFEKFFRMPTGDVHNVKGHGLGLSYVMGVVKAHGWAIEVMSEVGKGSTFVVHLPKQDV
jgi:two-component system phosphate regulon sensor histidine kinase PhoR